MAAVHFTITLGAQGKDWTSQEPLPLLMVAFQLSQSHWRGRGACIRRYRQTARYCISQSPNWSGSMLARAPPEEPATAGQSGAPESSEPAGLQAFKLNTSEWHPGTFREGWGHPVAELRKVRRSYKSPRVPAPRSTHRVDITLPFAALLVYFTASSRPTCLGGTCRHAAGRTAAERPHTRLALNRTCVAI